MRQLGQTKVRFTPALWAKWLARFNQAQEEIRLREGIQEFRALLARQQDMKRRRW